MAVDTFVVIVIVATAVLLLICLALCGGKSSGKSSKSTYHINKSTTGRRHRYPHGYHGSENVEYGYEVDTVRE